ncbi:hypothetical protein D3C80_1371240 [compost metagenome]
MPYHLATVGRAKNEGRDDLTLGQLFRDSELAPAVPTTTLAFDGIAQVGFATPQDVGQEPIGFAPGIENFRGGRLTENIADRSEKCPCDIGVMFRQDVIADMLMGNPLNNRGQDCKVFDVLRVSEDCSGKRMYLRATFTLVGVVKQVLDVLVFKQPGIHALGDFAAMRGQGWNTGFHQFDSLRRKLAGHSVSFLIMRCGSGACRRTRS